jgi:hypothetical protein
MEVKLESKAITASNSNRLLPNYMRGKMDEKENV